MMKPIIDTAQPFKIKMSTFRARPQFEKQTKSHFDGVMNQKLLDSIHTILTRKFPKEYGARDQLLVGEASAR